MHVLVQVSNQTKVITKSMYSSFRLVFNLNNLILDKDGTWLEVIRCIKSVWEEVIMEKFVSE